jgi:hypothetical protein
MLQMTRQFAASPETSHLTTIEISMLATDTGLLAILSSTHLSSHLNTIFVHLDFYTLVL